MVMHTGGRVVLSANKAGQIRNMLNQYIVESNSGTYDYVKALAAFSSRDEGALACVALAASTASRLAMVAFVMGWSGDASEKPRSSTILTSLQSLVSLLK